LEWEHARNLAKPRYAYIYSNKALFRADVIEADDKRSLQQAFIELVSSERQVGYFNEVSDLTKKVERDMGRPDAFDAVAGAQGAGNAKRNPTMPEGFTPGIADGIGWKPPSDPQAGPVTRLLFPFLSNQAGFDTGISISNMSAEPFAYPWSGKCRIHYFGTFLSDRERRDYTQTTTADVAPGQTLVATLSGGGTNGIAAVPGFQGYAVAICYFSPASGAAYFSMFGGTDGSIYVAKEF